MKKNLIKLLNNSQYGVSFSMEDELSLAEKTGLSTAEVEDAALEQGIIPLRYTRNLGVISLDEQRKLLHSRVSIIGCGGLGGFVIEELARLGIGEISVWDYDYFQEHNLNRQLMSEMRFIGRPKIEAAGQRVKRVNPGIKFNAWYREFDTAAGQELLKGQHVVVDALDNINARLELSEVCRDLGIPLVHGAVSSWYGQVCTQFPQEDSIKQIYAGKSTLKPGKREKSVLVFVPALIGTLQAAEVLKILLNRGELLRQKILLLDLLEMDIEIIDIPAQPG